MIALLLVPVGFLLAGAGSAAAQDDDEAAQTIHVRVNNEFLDEDGERVRRKVCLTFASRWSRKPASQSPRVSPAKTAL